MYLRDREIKKTICTPGLTVLNIKFDTRIQVEMESKCWDIQDDKNNQTSRGFEGLSLSELQSHLNRGVRVLLARSARALAGDD
jgi:hypothetical protein